ncbi:nSTAND1 domain-containing NTPase [Sorangium atrum]|uniref:TIR domain-containing protein n=1 Tax=Sorangium atrum TaxID=2995308 RepID=A0ABT5BTS0_9BACT|nr:TIR domain-containing protein [Sorangium aterium]MDC0677559.1 TIR domain-containing protein [Sorangium aterium]
MPAQLFLAFADEDRPHLDALVRHLAGLERAGIVAGWHEGRILAGATVGAEVEARIEAADVLVLLISADFLASDRCYALIERALARHDDGRQRLVPVIVRPSPWQPVLGGLRVLPPDDRAVTLAPDRDAAWLAVVDGLRAAVSASRPTLAPALAASPYRGLSAFEPGDEALFFGREDLTRRLWRRLDAQVRREGALRLCAVVGSSGSGKSSVARAGLVPLVAREPLGDGPAPDVILLKPGERPTTALADALCTLDPRWPARPAAERIEEARRLRSLLLDVEGGEHVGLRRYAELRDGRRPLLVLVDQFEEVYALCNDPAEQSAFVSLLLHAAADRASGVSVVLTLRSDFLDATRRHPALNRAIAQAHELVPVMAPAELRRAIAAPALAAGRPLDDATVELLAREADGREGALPLLEFALTQIWTGLAAGQPAAATLEAIGGVGGALAGEAERIFGELDDEGRRIARRAFLGLVQLGEGTRDTRRRVPVAELTAHGESADAALGVLRRFAGERARLVTLSDDVAEVTHEALLDHWKELRSWLEKGRDDVRFHRRVGEAAARWDALGRQEGSLWRAPELDLLRAFAERAGGDLTALQLEFFRAAEERQRQEQEAAARLAAEERRRQVDASRRARILAASSALVTVVFMGLAWWAVRQQRAAEEASMRYRDRLARFYEQQGREEYLAGRPARAAVYLDAAYKDRPTAPATRFLLARALPGALTGREVARLEGHTDKLWSAAFSPDGERVATVGLDTIARLWDARSGKELARLEGHTRRLYSVAFSPDGARVLTASDDGTARLWDAKSGKELARLEGHADGERMVASFGPDGTRVVTASHDKTARVWDAQSGKELARLEGHTDHVEAAAFSPDGTRIVTASWDTTARIWDAQSGKELIRLQGHAGPLFAASFSPDGTRVLTSGKDVASRLWDAASGKEVSQLKSDSEMIWTSSFSPDGKRVVTAAINGFVRLWDVANGKELASFSHNGVVWWASFSPDGTRVVTASHDKTARLWDARTGRLSASLEGHTDGVSFASFSPDGTRVVTASADKTARLWAVHGERVLSLDGHQGQVWSASFSSDGKRVVTASFDQTARVWDAQSGKEIMRLPDCGYPLWSASFSPDGKRVVVPDSAKTARVWEVASGKELVRLASPDLARSVTITTPDGKTTATPANDGRSVVVAFSPDGERVVTAGVSDTAQIWDAASGKELVRLEGHQGQVWSASFSPDGARIVTASDDRTARIWDAGSGKELVRLEGKKGSLAKLFGASFSPDGARVVTASFDKTARMWDARSGEELLVFEGHQDLVWSAAFSPDGERVVTASEDRTARIWDARSGRELARLEGHGERISSASFSPDGERVVTADDQTARIWDVHLEARPPEEIGRLVRCYVPLRLEGETIVRAAPSASDCPSP